MRARQSIRSGAATLASLGVKALVLVVFVLLFLDSGFEVDITTVALMMGLLASPRLLLGFSTDAVRRVLRRRHTAASADSPPRIR